LKRVARFLRGQADEVEDSEGAGGGVDSRLEEEVEGEGIAGVGAGHVDIDAVK
jgi:hypothetical protein